MLLFKIMLKLQAGIRIEDDVESKFTVNHNEDMGVNDYVWSSLAA